MLIHRDNREAGNAFSPAETVSAIGPLCQDAEPISNWHSKLISVRKFHSLLVLRGLRPSRYRSAAETLLY